jgi:hypothetical protein
MFGREVGFYCCAGILELCVRVRKPKRGGAGGCRRRCAPLLDRKKEIVAGTVTSVVIVKMK